MLARKVARLMAGASHHGSAWLISEEYALTALHCVQSDDGIARSEISLVFQADSAQIEADILQIAEVIDVALLRLKTPVTDLSNVISLSRSAVSLSDELALHGHPAATATASPQGVSLPCTVVDPSHEYKGTTGKLSLKSIAMHSATTAPSSAGGQSTSGLKGASGGVVTKRIGIDSATAIGLVIEDSLNGNHIHAVPIFEIAKHFPQVLTALDASPHIDTSSPRILVRVAESGRIQWSGSILPNEVSKLWELPPAKPAEMRIFIAPKLSELGPSDDALLRLSAYANLKSLRVPDQEVWRRRLQKLDDTHRGPDATVTFDIGTNEESCPAAWVEFGKEELSSLIHATLDIKILDWLHDELYNCLKNGTDSGLGEKIEDNLSDAMWSKWGDWEMALRNDMGLLQHFLGRIFEIDAAAAVAPSNFASIGFCSNVRKQLLVATLYALALDASGVTTAPKARDIGNLDVADQSGHTCGVSKRDQRDFRRFASSVDWKSDVVFLPYLPYSLRELYEKSVPMTRAEGTQGHSLTQSLPIALTAEDAFLHALSIGSKGVRDFYEKQSSERGMRLAALKLPSRTEPLDA